MNELPKYIKVASLEKANELSEEYSLRTPIVYTYQRMVEGVVGGVQTDVEYLMSLREESKYDNIEKHKKVQITFDEQPIPEGWEVIHHTSKELILVKRGEDALRQELRDWLDKDGELDSIISIIEDHVP